VAAGSQCDVPVTSTDFYPTLLEAAGLPLRPIQHLDGLSLLKLLQGATALEREAIFWHYPHYGNQGGRPGASVRMGTDKLIERFEDRQVELYDLARDPGETRDLSRDRPERVRQMRQVLHDWQREVMARIPEPNAQFAVGR
jgi:arylsulfatase A-like enzyme